MSQQAKLRILEKKAQEIRRQLKYAKNGEVLYQSPEAAWSEREIIVEADGLGRATLLVIEGNYPIDYIVHSEQAFSSEEKAMDAADALVQ